MDYKTIKDGTAYRMSNWENRPSRRAMVHDLGSKDFYRDYCTDEDRLYGSPRTMFLSNDPAYYEQDDLRYANPITLEPGEIVRLEGTELLYRVVPATKNYQYITTITYFELVKD